MRYAGSEQRGESRTRLCVSRIPEATADITIIVLKALVVVADASLVVLKRELR